MTSYNTIPRSQVREVIESTKGRIFGVTFIKKNRTTRVLNGRLGVTKGLKGTGGSWNPKALGTGRFVYDVQKEGYRTVLYDKVTALRVNGVIYHVIHDDDFRRRILWVQDRMTVLYPIMVPYYDVTPLFMDIMRRHIGAAYDEIMANGGVL